MNKTASALLIKTIVTILATWFVFSGLYNNSLLNIIIVGILGAIFNYVIGDLFILPKFGNVVASISDGALALITAKVYSIIMLQFQTTLYSLILFGIIVAVFEYFFHNYLLKSKAVEP